MFSVWLQFILLIFFIWLHVQCLVTCSVFVSSKWLKNMCLIICSVFDFIFYAWLHVLYDCIPNYIFCFLLPILFLVKCFLSFRLQVMYTIICNLSDHKFGVLLYILITCSFSYHMFWAWLQGIWDSPLNDVQSSPAALKKI